ncbi:High-affinity nitrate transporter 2.1 [Entomortierella beljakovae]|nr:High-affinity nitrate transporter 2.1 [Entomortierella beljakovae]
MRGLHLSWMSFFVAFTGWFAIPPLMPTIRGDLNLTASQISDANLTSVSATILARLTVGPLCDRYGPRKVMAGLLLVGSIPVVLVGFVADGTGLIISRFFIGIIGATFVPCQHWTSTMFASEVVGAANAICGGFGNMGAGVSYFLIPLIYNLIATKLPPHEAWRVTMVVPAFLCIFMAVVDYFLGDDCPNGDWKDRDKKKEFVDVELQGMPQVNSDIDSIHSGLSDKGKLFDRKDLFEDPANIDRSLVIPPEPTGAMAVFAQLKNPTVLILMFQYGCSFGLELAVDNVIGEIFHLHFGFAQTTAGMLGSIFGLMNLFSRASGGILADYVNSQIGEGDQGRMLIHFIILFCEGVFLIGFSFVMDDLRYSIGILVLFSYFVQAGCGTTFSLVPFVNPRSLGSVYGLVAAGGSAGSIVFSYVFKIYGADYVNAFRTIGCVVFAASIMTLFLLIQSRMLLGLFFKNLNP